MRTERGESRVLVGLYRTDPSFSFIQIVDILFLKQHLRDHKIGMFIETLAVSAASHVKLSSTRSRKQLPSLFRGTTAVSDDRLLLMMCIKSDSAVAKTLRKTTEW